MKKRPPGGTCTTLTEARDLFLLSIGSCGKGPPRHFRIAGLVPDGVTELEIVKEGGAIGRTVPVIDDTVAFSVGQENLRLRAIGDTAGEPLERTLPLGQVDRGRHDGGAGCTGYTSFEEKQDPAEAVS